LANNNILTGALLICTLIIILFVYLISQIAKLKVGRFLITAFIPIVFTISLGQFTHKTIIQFLHDDEPTSHTSPINVNNLSGRNVYYIILDGYPGYSSLRRLTKFDNSRFIKKLKNLGFVHLDQSRSAYFTTYLSLAAIVDANLLATEETKPYINRSQFYPRILNKSPLPKLFRHFQNGGYNLFLASNHWGGCPPKDSPIICLNYDSIFKRMLNYQFLTFLDDTPAGWLFAKTESVILRDDAINLANSRLGGMLKRTPFFVFIHDLRPHDPAQYSDCSSRKKSPDKLDMNAVVQQIECLNQDVTNLVKKIINQDKLATIIIQSDHGSGININFKWRINQWTEEAINTRSDILNLVRVAPKCRRWIKSNLNQINTARLIMGCSKGKKPDFLPNISFGALYEDSPDYGKVFRLKMGIK